jgi:hypothetical protein
MMQRRMRPPAGPLVVWAVVLGVVGSLAGCEGRTLLEGELLRPPPEITVDRAVTSAEVHAGSTARLRLRAESRASGVASIRVDWTGVVQGGFERSYPGAPPAVVLDTAIAIPPGAEPGDLVFTATATSAAGVSSEPVRITMQVIGPDVDPPEVSVASTVPDRVERDDSMAVTIRCREDSPGGQLAWCGYTVLFYPTGGDTITVVRRDTVLARDTAAIRDVLPIQGYDPATLPTELNIEVHGFAIDAAGNCAAGVREAWSRESCVGVTSILADVEDEPTRVTVVASTTVRRDWAGTVEDLAVDEVRGRVYASVIDRNRIEVLDYTVPRTQARRPDILVGSRPAGIAMDRTGDTLIVANSGGTSLSFVDLAQGQERSRLETPNSALYQLRRNPCTPAPIVFWEDYGDRPHQVAQDRDGVILYSTTSGGPIRMVEHSPGWQAREANIMFWSDVVVGSRTHTTNDMADASTWAVAYVDSITIKPESRYVCNPATDSIIIHDHVPGFPNQRISGRGTIDSLHLAILEVRAKGSDILAKRDSVWAVDYWNVGQEARFGTSRDRSTVAVADGTRAWTWIASGSRPGFRNRQISWYLSIDDLSNNMELGIAGLSVDRTGKQFSVRGDNAVVYFDDLLRVHGSHQFDELSGQAGVALHPDLRLAFAPTNDRSVLVLQTDGHYQVTAELPLVETIVGQLHFSLPRGGDPADLVGRLHGVTGSGNVVTLPVRLPDLQ